MDKKLSVIVPCYNEEEAINVFYQEVLKVLTAIPGYEYEIIFINDGSKDKTLEIMKMLTKSDPSVKYISFTRNFGKEAALLAGLNHATGSLVVTMDVDLQDPPALLPTMVQVIDQEGYDSVATRRVSRQGEPPLRSFCARLFYKLINKLSDAQIMDGARDYRMMKRKMVDSILQLKEYHRFSKGIFGWVGYDTKWLEYQNIERIAGETKWSFWKLFKYAIGGIVAFSTIPLRLASFVGLVLSLMSLAFLIFIITRKLLIDDPVAGWASTVSIIVFIGGIQITFLGIIGEYLAKTYMEAKARPTYFVKESS